MKEIEFLTLAELIEIQKDQIKRYGGISGIRDVNLLSSAMAMPESMFDGKYLHDDLCDKAAAYAYHISQNHPFLDGNKRAALASALVFLDFNGVELDDPDGQLYDVMMRVAEGSMKKDQLALIFRKLQKK